MTIFKHRFRYVVRLMFDNNNTVLYHPFLLHTSLSYSISLKVVQYNLQKLSALSRSENVTTAPNNWLLKFTIRSQENKKQKIQLENCSLKTVENFKQFLKHILLTLLCYLRVFILLLQFFIWKKSLFFLREPNIVAQVNK